jgi:DNA-binding FadR family transcriptional regulator
MSDSFSRTSHRIAEWLLEFIRRTQVGPGGRLPSEHTVARATRAGRSSVREGFQLLVGRGLIDARPGKGYYLRPAPRRPQARTGTDGSRRGAAQDIEDVREARIVIEGACAALAAVRATPEDAARIEALLAGMEAKQSSGSEVYEDTLRFHLTVAEAAHNRTLHDILRVLIPRIAAHGAALASEIPDHGAIDLALHRELWAAIRSGHPGKARTAMERHIRDASSLYLLPYEWPAVGAGAGRPDAPAAAAPTYAVRTRLPRSRR